MNNSATSKSRLAWTLTSFFNLDVLNSEIFHGIIVGFVLMKGHSGNHKLIHQSRCVSAEMGCVENQDSTSRLSVNQWVVVTYNAQWYPGKIVEVQENGYIISAMESLGAQQWRWPLRPDVLFYERSQMSACADPTMVGSRSRISFSFDFWSALHNFLIPLFVITTPV